MRVSAAMRLSPAIVLLAALYATTSLAQTVQERRQCEGNEDATPAQRIAACSAVIKGGKDKGEKLAESYDHRGAAYRGQGDLNAAIKDYDQAIKLNSKFAQAYNNRGVAYDHKGDLDHAMSDFEQSIKLKPTALAHFNRGNAYLGKSQYDHAIDDFNQAIKLKPDLAAAFDNRCWARAVVGLLKQALADCNEALRLMPNNAATLESRAFIFLKMANFDLAVSDYDAALAAHPKLATALYGRGLAKLKNEDATGAADIAAAKAIQSDIAEDYARYGMPPAQ